MPNTLLPRQTMPGPGDIQALTGTMLDLYRQQLATDTDPYLVQHAEPARVAGQARVFGWYAPQLPAEGAVLDVGCAHGPDSCMLRAAFGDRFELHGCDFFEEDRFPVFREFSDMRYIQLRNNLALPYPDECFDVVIASGMLEHTAMDYEALKEIYRILKFNGTLIVTYLPNKLSSAEWYHRRVRKVGFHRRLYGLSEADQLLRRTGLYPVVPVQYQSFHWEKRLEKALSSRNVVRRLAQILKTVFPIQIFSSTLCCVAVKVHGM